MSWLVRWPRPTLWKKTRYSHRGWLLITVSDVEKLFQGKPEKGCLRKNSDRAAGPGCQFRCFCSPCLLMMFFSWWENSGGIAQVLFWREESCWTDCYIFIDWMPCDFSDCSCYKTRVLCLPWKKIATEAHGEDKKAVPLCLRDSVAKAFMTGGDKPSSWISVW